MVLSECHESLAHAKVAWERIIKQIKINSLSIVAMLQGLDQI